MHHMTCAMLSAASLVVASASRQQGPLSLLGSRSAAAISVPMLASTAGRAWSSTSASSSSSPASPQVAAGAAASTSVSEPAATEAAAAAAAGLSRGWMSATIKEHPRGEDRGTWTLLHAHTYACIHAAARDLTCMHGCPALPDHSQEAGELLLDTQGARWEASQVAFHDAREDLLGHRVGRVWAGSCPTGHGIL